MQARSASCRGPYGSTGMQGGLRRGADGTVLLGKVCYGRVWCIGEGMQEGHALKIRISGPLNGRSPSRPPLYVTVAASTAVRVL
jgi:hypothetical protein